MVKELAVIENLTWGKIVVASVPIAAYDWFALFTMQMCTDRPFGCLVFPAEMLFVIAVIGTFFWVRYVAKSLLKQRKEKPDARV